MIQNQSLDYLALVALEATFHYFVVSGKNKRWVNDVTALKKNGNAGIL
jgi:hypothetical protein